MSSLAERLSEALAKKPGASQADLARACGVKPPSVHGWFTGKTKSLKGVSLVRAANFLGVSKEWLSEGRGKRNSTDLEHHAAEITQLDSAAWPFPAVPREAIEALPPAKLERLQGALALALAQVQQDLIVPVKPQEKRGSTVSLDDAGDPFPMVLREPMPWEAGWKPTEAADLPTRVQDRGGVVANVSPGTPPAANDRFEKVVELGEVRLAAGEGIENEHELETGAIQFRRSFLRSVGADGGRGRVVYAKGNSMEPQIPDGSALLLVPSDAVDVRSLVPNSVYAINYDGKMIVKTVTRDQRTGKWLARSANSSYPDIALEGDALVRILGRVVWAGGLLREGDSTQWVRR